MERLRNRILYALYLATMGSYFEFVTGFRRRILKALLRQDLDHLLVRPHVYISGYRRLKIGRHVSINHHCFLSCDGGLEIGDYVSIGHDTSILTTEHTYADPVVPIKYQPVTFSPVRLGSNIWIGAKVTILAGVSIADGTVIAAGSVVSRSVDVPNTVVAGVPARFLKERLETPSPVEHA